MDLIQSIACTHTYVMDLALMYIQSSQNVLTINVFGCIISLEKRGDLAILALGSLSLFRKVGSSFSVNKASSTTVITQMTAL